jgi:hypothetical protein
MSAKCPFGEDKQISRREVNMHIQKSVKSLSCINEFWICGHIVLTIGNYRSPLKDWSRQR